MVGHALMIYQGTAYDLSPRPLMIYRNTRRSWALMIYHGTVCDLPPRPLMIFRFASNKVDKEWAPPRPLMIYLTLPQPAHDLPEAAHDLTFFWRFHGTAYDLLRVHPRPPMVSLAFLGLRSSPW
eukprot:1471328-Amphidinium_carterae.1